MQKSIGKSEIRPPCKIVTPKNFNLKLCTRDYVRETTHHAHFGYNQYSGGFSPNRRNISTLWLFFDCPVLFLGNAPTSNRWTDFHALWLKRRVWRYLLVVRTLGDVIWGNMPQNSQKWQWIHTFKPKCRNVEINISKTIKTINAKFEEQAETALCGWSNVTQIKSSMVAILKKSIWRQVHRG